MRNPTPEPWSWFVTRSGKLASVHANHVFICELSKRSNPDFEANARLIAAAPDLLEALQEGLEMSKYAAAINFDGSPNTIEWCYDLYQKLDYFQKIAAAAIEKAEGAK